MMHDEVNKILAVLTAEISHILTDNLIGLYLTGSLSYDDFHPDKSDIDLVAITKTFPSAQHLEALKLMHREIEKENKKWSQRIECS
ncbi:nucleotidyltransferase domain-containing protein [Candidatus Odyssella thessalonicensis]|uniref:nucleotidyltransferase domain-containing protein n=1 Tax=Candidatus Odyssella thessalonicensis TaxID=84647 RepID=UPI0002E2659D|nr:nucleotidyltransferase domain-containing protein [Candidatus Odyssella thessalonicensis]